MRLNKTYAVVLLLNAASFAFFAVKWATTPNVMATGLGIQLTNADAVTDAQAVYGGLEMGVALFLAICAFKPQLQWAGLLAATLTLAGLASFRGIGVLVSPTAVTRATTQLLTTDLSGAVLNGVALFFASRRKADA